MCNDSLVNGSCLAVRPSAESPSSSQGCASQCDAEPSCSASSQQLLLIQVVKVVSGAVMILSMLLCRVLPDLSLSVLWLLDATLKVSLGYGHNAIYGSVVHSSWGAHRILVSPSGSAFHGKDCPLSNMFGYARWSVLQTGVFAESALGVQLVDGLFWLVVCVPVCVIVGFVGSALARVSHLPMQKCSVWVASGLFVMAVEIPIWLHTALYSMSEAPAHVDEWPGPAWMGVLLLLALAAVISHPA
jgi:hypothetical protein